MRYRILLLVLVMFTSLARAQETTSTLSGQVKDENKKPLSDVTLVVKHLPTGTITGTQTNGKGSFLVPNLKPGGPYMLKFTFVGLKEKVVNDVYLSLGENTPIEVSMESSTAALKEVSISAVKTRSSGGLNLGREQINALPTIGRSLSDFTRLTPQSNNNSFAGTNFRYNNITLDGAVNNDAIGFSNSFGGVSGGGQAGTAGAGTRTNPYSLDAIQEVQVQLAPYDVKLGNFTGGSVNAITKSGTNDFHGSAYAYGRNQQLVGNSVDGLKTPIGSDFYDFQTGASLGGKIIKDKLFFFVNAEFTRHQEPTFYNAGDPGSALDTAEARQIVNKLQTKYGYNPGSTSVAQVQTNSDKYFARLDWNISKKHNLMVRAIYTNGWGNNIERTSTNFQFGTTDFTQHTINFNAVAELKSTFNKSLSNQLIVSTVNVHEYRDFPGTMAPFVDIASGKYWLGTWREASVYNMHQQTYELTDNVTLYKGNHKFTFGTHNEFYNINYGFVNSWNGRWEYASVSDFLADKPTRIRAAYNFNPSDNNRDNLYNGNAGQFNVNLLSAYAQDEIAVSSRFKVTPGVRVDYSFVNTQPTTDSAITKTADYISKNPTYSHTSFSSFNNQWLGTPYISPRLGFNWDVKGDGSLVIRGGSGIFVGRMPFAWLGYAYTLSGSTYGTIDYQPKGTKQIGLAIDPSTLRDTINKYGGAAASATHEVDLVDNNFKLPTAWRSSIAADIKLGNGYKLTLDAMYTKTVYDVQFQQINLKDTVTYLKDGPSQSPVYVGGKVNPAFSNVYLLTNTNEGYRYNLTAQLSKQFNTFHIGKFGAKAFLMAAYTYGMSKDLSNGIRNSFQSNYEVNPSISPNNPSLAYSNFDLRHRVVSSANLHLDWNKSHSSFVTFYFSAASGSPYTLIYSSSPNQFNNSSNANLIYVPRDASDIRFSDIKTNGVVTYSAAQQSADFDAFINSDSYLSGRRGQYVERNGMRTPWNYNLDMRFMHEFKFKVSQGKTNSLQLTMDLFNVLNLLDSEWGHQYFVTNTNNYAVNVLKAVNDASGVAPGKGNYAPTYNFVKPAVANQYYTVDPISSRWQMQLGVKYVF